MVMEALLPHRAGTAQGAVDGQCSAHLYSLYNLSEGGVMQNEHPMKMIRHDDPGKAGDLFSIVKRLQFPTHQARQPSAGEQRFSLMRGRSDHIRTACFAYPSPS